MRFTDRLQHAWNAFLNKDPPNYLIGYGSAIRPDRARYTRGNERSIVSSIYTRIATDAAAISFEHVRLDNDGRFFLPWIPDLTNVQPYLPI